MKLKIITAITALNNSNLVTHSISIFTNAIATVYKTPGLGALIRTEYDKLLTILDTLKKKQLELEKLIDDLEKAKLTKVGGGYFELSGGSGRSLPVAIIPSSTIQTLIDNAKIALVDAKKLIAEANKAINDSIPIIKKNILDWVNDIKAFYTSANTNYKDLKIKIDALLPTEIALKNKLTTEFNSLTALLNNIKKHQNDANIQQTKALAILISSRTAVVDLTDILTIIDTASTGLFDLANKDKNTFETNYNPILAKIPKPAAVAAAAAAAAAAAVGAVVEVPPPLPSKIKSNDSVTNFNVLTYNVFYDVVKSTGKATTDICPIVDEYSNQCFQNIITQINNYNKINMFDFIALQEITGKEKYVLGKLNEKCEPNNLYAEIHSPDEADKSTVVTYYNSNKYKQSTDIPIIYGNSNLDNTPGEAFTRATLMTFFQNKNDADQKICVINLWNGHPSKNKRVIEDNIGTNIDANFVNLIKNATKTTDDKEVDKVKAFFADNNNKIIMMGDFNIDQFGNLTLFGRILAGINNDDAWSNTCCSDLKSSTFTSGAFDNILVSDNCKTLNKVQDNISKTSDHLAVIGNINLIIPKMMIDYSHTFFEKQESTAGCGRHALNNLLGYKQFDNVNANDIIETNIYKFNNTSDDISEPTPNIINIKTLCKFLKTKELGNDLCGDGTSENYDILLLIIALNIIGFKVEIIDNISIDTVNQNLLGYIINIGGGYHWAAIVKTKYGNDTDTNFTLIDSLNNTRDKQKFATLHEIHNNTDNNNIKYYLKVLFTGNYDDTFINGFNTEKISKIRTNFVVEPDKLLFEQNKQDLLQLFLTDIKLNDKNFNYMREYIINLKNNENDNPTKLDKIYKYLSEDPDCKKHYKIFEDVYNNQDLRTISYNIDNLFYSFDKNICNAQNLTPEFEMGGGSLQNNSDPKSISNSSPSQNIQTHTPNSNSKPKSKKHKKHTKSKQIKSRQRYHRKSKKRIN